MYPNTFGFEMEFFVRKAGVFTLAEGLPRDACGYLAEARGENHRDPLSAAYLFKAEARKLALLAQSMGLELVRQETADIPKEQLRIWLRKFGKNSAHSFFMGGGAYRNNNPRAGLHIHFGSQRKIITKDGATETVAEITNMPRIIWLMDKEFKEDIKHAKRVPGEYEIKPHGFEYRSLPSIVDVERVAMFIINTILRE